MLTMIVLSHFMLMHQSIRLHFIERVIHSISLNAIIHKVLLALKERVRYRIIDLITVKNALKIQHGLLRHRALF